MFTRTRRVDAELLDLFFDLDTPSISHLHAELVGSLLRDRVNTSVLNALVTLARVPPGELVLLHSTGSAQAQAPSFGFTSFAQASYSNSNELPGLSLSLSHSRPPVLLSPVEVYACYVLRRLRAFLSGEEARRVEEQPYQTSCALLEAVKYHQYLIARVLVYEYGANCNRIGADHCSAVDTLSRRGDDPASLALLQELLHYRFRVVDSSAASGASVPAVQVEVDTREGDGGGGYYTALHSASELGHLSVVELL